MDAPDPVINQLYLQQISHARQDLKAFFASKEGNPTMMLRFAWNDAGTYNAGTRTGMTIAELTNAARECARLKDKYPELTYADIIQLAGVVAVEVTGGPLIDFVPGRKDSSASFEPGRIPAEQGGGQRIPYNMVTFNRMGLSSKEIVALSGGLYLGRREQLRFRVHDVPHITVPLKFDNSYFSIKMLSSAIMQKQRRDFLNWGLHRKTAPLDFLEQDLHRRTALLDCLNLNLHRRTAPLGCLNLNLHRRTAPLGCLNWDLHRRTALLDFQNWVLHRKTALLGFTPMDCPNMDLHRRTTLLDFKNWDSHGKTALLGFPPKKSTTGLVPRFLPPAVATSIVVYGLCYLFKFPRIVSKWVSL